MHRTRERNNGSYNVGQMEHVKIKFRRNECLCFVNKIYIESLWKLGYILTKHTNDSLEMIRQELV